MVTSRDMQLNLAAAGDSVAAVAAVLSAGATFFALRGLHLQRVALTDQRNAFAQQLKAQQDAVAEDHRQQRAANLHTVYAEFFRALREAENSVTTAIEMEHEKPVGVTLINAMRADVMTLHKALSHCQFMDYNVTRYDAIRKAVVDISESATPLLERSASIAEGWPPPVLSPDKLVAPSVNVMVLEGKIASSFHREASGALVLVDVGLGFKAEPDHVLAMAAAMRERAQE